MNPLVEKSLNAALKFGITKLLGQIPAVGGLLSAVVGAIWPSGGGPLQPTPDQVFDSIKDRIGALVDQTVLANNIAQIKTSVAAIGREVAFYQGAADADDAKSKFVAAQAVIIAELQKFQQQGMEAAFLIFYAQAVNAWLAFLRDGVIAAPGWTMTAAERTQLQHDFAAEIVCACAYVDKWYASGLLDRQKQAAAYFGADKFNCVNEYVREMTLLVLDYREVWQYFDPIAYPNPVKHVYTREIYMPARGIKRSDTITLPPPPKGPIRAIKAVSWTYGLKQLTVDYDAGMGPGGRDGTGPMGRNNINGYKETTLQIAGATITNVRTSVGVITDGIAFDGVWKGKPFSTNLLGATGSNPLLDNAVEGHVVSSIYLDGSHLWNNDFYPDTVVVGLMLAPDP